MNVFRRASAVTRHADPIPPRIPGPSVERPPPTPGLLARRDAGPVLVAVDGRNWGPLEWAAAEASARGCALHIIHAIEWPLLTLDPLGGVSMNWRDNEAPQRGALLLVEAERRARCVSTDLPIQVDVKSGSAGTEILRAGRYDALIVVGQASRGLRPWRRSATWKVARGARSPMVAVNLDEQRTSGLSATRVVVGVDSNRDATGTLGVAFRSALRRGLGLTIVRAWTPRDPDVIGADLTEASLPPVETIFDGTLRVWRAMFPEVDVRQAFVSGPLGPGLVEHSKGAALVVVGATSRGRLHRWLFESITRTVLQSAKCPVTLVGRRARTS